MGGRDAAGPDRRRLADPVARGRAVGRGRHLSHLLVAARPRRSVAWWSRPAHAPLLEPEPGADRAAAASRCISTTSCSRPASPTAAITVSWRSGEADLACRITHIPKIGNRRHVTLSAGGNDVSAAHPPSPFLLLARRQGSARGAADERVGRPGAAYDRVGGRGAIWRARRDRAGRAVRDRAGPAAADGAAVGRAVRGAGEVHAPVRPGADL